MDVTCNRFPSGPAYDLGGEPQYDCAAGCGYAAWEPGELHACITCQKRFCADCLVAIGGEKFCAEHAKCACGQPAIDSCVDCGALKCGTCFVKDHDICDDCADAAERKASPDPADLPDEAYDPDNARCL